MGERREKIAGLLKRFQFIDLSRALARQGEERRFFLTEYVDRPPARFRSYEPFRKCYPSIYRVQKGLDPSPPPDWPAIRAAIVRTCAGIDEDFNLDVSKALFDFLADQQFEAFGHRERSLPLGPDRTVAFRLEHYLVRDGKAIFQFPFPRSERLTERELQLMLALIAHTYRIGDFAEAGIEIADLSRPKAYPTREPRIIVLDEEGLPSMDALSGEIQDVYRLLMELSDET